MTNIPLIDVHEIQKQILTNEYDVLKINANFDITKLQSKTETIMNNFKLIEKDGYSLYKAIGLQYNDDNNSLYDSVQQLRLIDQNSNVLEKRKIIDFHSKKNIIGNQFSEIFNYFEPHFKLTRGRILLAEAGFKMKLHTDGQYCGTLHIPIITNPEVSFNINNKEFYLPADGDAYLINVGLPHSLRNNSVYSRVHITFPLTPLSFKNWKKEDLLKFSNFFNMIEISDPESYF